MGRCGWCGRFVGNEANLPRFRRTAAPWDDGCRDQTESTRHRMNGAGIHSKRFVFR